jgi:hypothetical protein
LLGEFVSDAVTDCEAPDTDKPREAFKGLPVVTEAYSEGGVYLSTDATAYRLRQLYSGRDRRKVRHAFQAATRKMLYDVAAGVPTAGSSSSFSAIEHNEVGRLLHLRGAVRLGRNARPASCSAAPCCAQRRSHHGAR